MKNTNTTLMQLSHKYASVLKKCAILNAAIFMTALPVMANTVWQPGTEKDKVIFSGEIDLSGKTNVEQMHALDATLKNLVFTGFWDGTTEMWGNFSGINANLLRIEGDVSLKLANVYMTGDDIGEDEEDPLVYNLTNKYTKGDTVSWNGKEYQIQSPDNTNFYDNFYSKFNEATDASILTELEDMTLKNLTTTRLAGIGAFYKQGTIFMTLKDGEYKYYRVDGKDGFTAYSREDMLGIDKSGDNPTSVLISGANLKMLRSNLAGEHSLDEKQEEDKMEEMQAARKRLIDSFHFEDRDQRYSQVDGDYVENEQGNYIKIDDDKYVEVKSENYVKGVDGSYIKEGQRYIKDGENSYTTNDTGNYIKNENGDFIEVTDTKNYLRIKGYDANDQKLTITRWNNGQFTLKEILEDQDILDVLAQLV